MKARLYPVMVTILLSLFFATAVFAAKETPLPKDYKNWKKSERKLDTDKKSLFYGSHYIYADKKAMQGYKAGNKFPEGSTIVVEYFNIKEGSAADGSKNMIVSMKKDKRFNDTLGWRFAGYGADGKPSGLNPATTCISCHQKDAAQRDYVISTIKDFK
jgi:hypothetical protein